MEFSELRLLGRYPWAASEPLLIDVGAHHGHVSIQFASMGWRVIAFEPEKKNRAVYLKNMEEFPNVVCYDKAVSDRSGNHVPFFVSNEHFGIHSLKPFHESHAHEYDVETATLDRVLAEEKVERVTFLKVDTEGADFLALKGFDVKRYQPEVIMLEFMDERSKKNFNYTHHDVVNYMTERGYAAFVSEWAPVREYARENEVGVAHKWLRCAPYPLDHEPSWGNLIFIPTADAGKFNKTLKSYLINIYTVGWLLACGKKIIKRIPGSKRLYRALTRT